MTLKHTNMAKWAKKQLSRGVKSPAVCVSTDNMHVTIFIISMFY